MTGCPDTCEERTKHVCRVRRRWLQASRATSMYHLDAVERHREHNFASSSESVGRFGFG
jgi:hypothetical protein